MDPISYATDLGRQLLLGSAGTNSLWFDMTYLAGFAAIFSTIGIIMSWKLLSQ